MNLTIPTQPSYCNYRRYSARMDPGKRSSIIGWLGSVFIATNTPNSLLNLDGRGDQTGPPKLPRPSLARSSPVPSPPSLCTIPRISYSFPDYQQCYTETQATELFPNAGEHLPLPARSNLHEPIPLKAQPLSRYDQKGFSFFNQMNGTSTIATMKRCQPVYTTQLSERCRSIIR